MNNTTFCIKLLFFSFAITTSCFSSYYDRKEAVKLGLYQDPETLINIPILCLQTENNSNTISTITKQIIGTQSAINNKRYGHYHIDNIKTKNDFSFDIIENKIILQSPDKNTTITVGRYSTELLMQKVWWSIDCSEQPQERSYYLHLIDEQYKYPAKEDTTIDELLSIEIPKSAIEIIINKKDQKLSELLHQRSQREKLYRLVISLSCTCIGIFLLCIIYLKSK